MFTTVYILFNNIIQMQQQKTPKIRVIIRKRPMSRKEQSKGQTDIIQIKDNSTVIVVQQKLKVDLTPYTDQYRFNFDGAYDQHSTNEDLYLTSVRPLVESAFDGAKVTCFAYGQTGSGKTYTMLGDNHNRIAGLYLLGAYDIFENLKKRQYQQYSVWISFYEIYCGKLYDLLNDRNILFARQDARQNVNIVGLQQKKVGSVESLMQIIEFGSSVRVTAQNGTNIDSSRSHAVLQIQLKINNKSYGKMSFIDLAGSQRAADHADQTYKQTRIDGAEINKSLLALKQCIRALDQNKNHTPFRGSKLTMVLKDSFTGYCRTLMIGNISPNSQSCENTLNTLKYADRVKQLKKPTKDNLNKQVNNLDELSKQLMLPRHFIPTQISQNQYNQRENQIYKKKQIKQSNRLSQKQTFLQPPQQKLNPLQNKNISISPSRQYTDIRQRLPPEPILFQQKMIRNPIQKYPKQETPPKLFLQPIRTKQEFIKLSKKHENYVQMIIQQQELVVKAHEKHINSNIQLIKQEMFLMNEADKIGSDIESYLTNLDNVLLKQLESIHQMRQKVNGLKQHLKESQMIEQQYFRQSSKFINQYDDEDLLDLREQQNLFY